MRNGVIRDAQRQKEKKEHASEQIKGKYSPQQESIDVDNGKGL